MIGKWFYVSAWFIFTSLTAFGVLLGLYLDNRLNAVYMFIPAFAGCGLLALTAVGQCIKHISRGTGVGLLAFVLGMLVISPVAVFVGLLYSRLQYIVIFPYIYVLLPLIIACGVASLIAFILVCVCSGNDRRVAPAPPKRASHLAPSIGSIQDGEHTSLLPHSAGSRNSASSSVYDVDHPAMADSKGAVLHMMAGIFSTAVGSLVARFVWSLVGMNKFRSLHISAPPTYYPVHHAVGASVASAATADADRTALLAALGEYAPAMARPLPVATASAIAAAYREGIELQYRNSLYLFLSISLFVFVL